MTFNKFLAVSATALIITLASHPVLADQIKEASQAKVTITEAIAKAQATQPGKVVKAKLEEEHGKLVYEIKIINNNQKIKVLVDAQDGSILAPHKH